MARENYHQSLTTARALFVATCCLALLSVAQVGRAACRGRHHGKGVVSSRAGSSNIAVLDWVCAIYPSVLRCLLLAVQERYQEFIEDTCCKIVISKCTDKVSCKFNKLCSKDTKPCQAIDMDAGNGNTTTPATTPTAASPRSIPLVDIPPKVARYVMRRAQSETEVDL